MADVLRSNRTPHNLFKTFEILLGRGKSPPRGYVLARWAPRIRRYPLCGAHSPRNAPAHQRTIACETNIFHTIKCLPEHPFLLLYAISMRLHPHATTPHPEFLMDLKIRLICGIAALLLTACAVGEEVDGPEACTPVCIDSTLLMSCTPDGLEQPVNCPAGCNNGACLNPNQQPPTNNECFGLLNGDHCTDGQKVITCLNENKTRETPCLNGCITGSSTCNVNPPSAP